MRDIGITSTLKGLLCFNASQDQAEEISGWKRSGDISILNSDNSFSLRIPLKFWFNLFDDYRMVIFGQHKIKLIRSRSDKNCYIANETKTANINISNIELQVKHVVPNDIIKIEMLENINKGKPIKIGFRLWSLVELPSLRKTKKEVWNIGTSTNAKRTRYGILAVQKNRKDNVKSDVTFFDNVNISDVKIYQNNECFPYEAQDYDFSKNRYSRAYKNYTNFQIDYMNRPTTESTLTFAQFKDRALFVLDCSKQSEAIKSSMVDMKIEIISNSTNFTEDMNAYCLTIHDAAFEYYPLTGQLLDLM